MTCDAHPVHDQLLVREVAGDDGEGLETGGAKPVATRHVAPVPIAAPVRGTVVLTHDSGHRVEEVGVADQPAVEVEHRWVDEGFGEPGVEPPAQVEEHLGTGAEALVAESDCLAVERYPLPGRARRRVASDVVQGQ